MATAEYRLWWLSATEYYRFRRRAEQRRLTLALAFALLAHASLLKLTFGGQAPFPGLDLRWLERRFEVPELRVALLPKATPVQAEPSPPTPSEPPSEPAAAAVPALPTVSIPQSMTEPAERADKLPALDPAPTVLAMPPSEKAVWVVPVPSEISTSTTAARQEAKLAETVSLEPERRDVARSEARRREAMSRAIGQPLEEGTGREAGSSPALAEAPRIQAGKVELARIDTPRIEAPPIEAPRIEVPLADPPRIEAARVETPRAPPAAVAQEDPEREARLRRLGRQLDEEAERRKSAADARPSPVALDSYRSPRRYRLFGRADPNEALLRYAEGWGRKIEMNMTLDMIREAVKLPHSNPLVTVAIRGDGSVESVAIVVSSGVPAIDQAIRHVVESQAPYAVFPPALALEYDVIEIRRTWHFDVAVRLD